MGISITAKDVEIRCPFPHVGNHAGVREHVDIGVPMVFASHGYGMLSVQDLADLAYQSFQMIRDLRKDVDRLQDRVNELQDERRGE